MWIASEVRLRVSIQWLMYRKRPGGRHDLPEHSFEHNNMHTSRRPASLMLTGLHTPESPVEPTGPNDTGSSTHSCSIGQLSNGMQRGPLPSPCSENRHHTPHAADRHIMRTCTRIPKLDCARMLPLLPPQPWHLLSPPTPWRTPTSRGHTRHQGRGSAPARPCGVVRQPRGAVPMRTISRSTACATAWESASDPRLYTRISIWR